jgi:hypothetical protein
MHQVMHLAGALPEVSLRMGPMQCHYAWGPGSGIMHGAQAVYAEETQETQTHTTIAFHMS